MTEDRYALADIFMDAVLTAHGERPVAVADLPVEAVDALRILAGGREVDAADARGVVIGQEIPLGSARPRDHRAVIVVERGAGRVITVIAVAPVRHASPRPSDEGGLAVVHDAIGAEEDALLAQSDAWDRHSIESQEQRRAWAFNTVAARIAAARGVQAHIVAADLRAAGIY